ncbi:MAG: T9SS type A sorting domain-containing protein [Candidatus Latescibacteria bacterium]|nr:T9SS type A sorting domain-containing protein [Candidatus Latescibacterota bacterium]
MVALLACLLLALPAWAQPPSHCATAYLKTLPLPRPLPPAAKPAQVPDQIGVGTAMTFYSSFDFQLIPATCRYLGDHSYIFVEDGQWAAAGGTVAQRDVDSLGVLFEDHSPADPRRGIYALETEAFGEPPDVDGDPRVFILVLDIPDESYVGYFDSGVATLDELPEFRHDMLFIDALYLTGQPYLTRGTLAHEFQHLIHWGKDPDEDTWVDEGLSGYAEEVAGYPEADPDAAPDFLRNPGVGLLWPGSTLDAQGYNYGGTYLFMSYLAQRQGRAFIRQLVAQPRNGTFGVDEAFTSQGVEGSFTDAWGGWVVGNYMADADYGYKALKGRRARATALRDLPIEEIEGQVSGRWGAQYVSLPVAGNLEIELSTGGQFQAWVCAWQGGRGAVQEVGLDAEGRGVLAAEGVDSLTVMVGRTAAQGRSYLISADHFIPTLVEGRATVPAALQLGAAYPNPFNSAAQIPMALPEAAEVQVAVYNSLGQCLRVLQAGPLASGTHQLTWDGRDEQGAPVGSGTYTVVLQAGQARLSRRLSLIK